MNRVVLMGNAGADPDIRTSKTNTSLAVFCLATDTRWINAHGEKQHRTDWHKVVVFKPKLVKWCEQYLKKGTKIIVEGQLYNCKHQNQDGQDFYSSEIIIGNGYGHITSLTPLPVSKQVNEGEQEDEEDRLALQRALAQHPSSIQQFSSLPGEGC